ncbi:MAG: hypothetical protein AABX07_05690 [Nanoarchaeota archaeon]
MNPIGKILSIFSLVGLIGCTDIDSRDAMKYGSMNYQEVIKAVETPAQVRAYILSNIQPEQSNITAGNIPFKKIHEYRKGDCSEAVITASALLSDNGYPPLHLVMAHSDKGVRHGVFVYKENNKWGTISINASESYNAKFSTLEEVSRTLGYDLYRLCRIHDEFIPDWVSTDRNLSFTAEEQEKLPEFSFLKVRNPVRVGRGAIIYTNNLEELPVY